MVKLIKYMHFSSIVTCIRTKEGLGLMEIDLKSSACRRPTRPSDARLDQVSKISLGLESWTRYALTKHGDPSSSSFVGSQSSEVAFPSDCIAVLADLTYCSRLKAVG